MPADTPLPLPNLLSTFAELLALLKEQVTHGSALNAFLLAAGANQIVEDFLWDPRGSSVAIRFLSGSNLPGRRLAISMARLAGALLSFGRARAGRPRRLIAWQRDLSRLVDVFADATVSGSSLTSVTPLALDLLRDDQQFPLGLSTGVVRLPTCFRTLDQSPRDLERIAQIFAELCSPERVVGVVGVRTSGSYLAPLFAALLRRRGYGNVQVFTVRPHQNPGDLRQRIEPIARAGGFVVVTDDPPKSGGALLDVCRQIERSGQPHSRIVLALALGDDRGLPEALRDYPAAVLQWSGWSIHQSLDPSGVEEDLSALIGSKVLVEKKAAAAAERTGRGHQRSMYRVVIPGSAGESAGELVEVRGVGLGYLGDHALAVREALEDWLPTSYGLRDGLLYSRRTEQAEAWPAGSMADLVRHAAAYVDARGRALPLADDVASRLIGRGATWYAARLLSWASGSLSPVLLPLTLKVARRLLRVEHPSVVDGAMNLEHWGREPGKFVKTHFDNSTFDNFEMHCADRIFDIAGAATTWEFPGVAAELRSAYEKSTGVPLDEERWALYRLLSLMRVGWQDPSGDRAKISRAMSAVWREYLGRAVLQDAVQADSGPIFAVDVDGVLESGELGFPATTYGGALALRALALHGIRVVLVSGRSGGEIRERCVSYRLTGGVAEYGAVVYSRPTDRSRSLLTEEQEADLSRLRLQAASDPEIHVDRAFLHSVRIYRHAGKRRGLPPADAARLMREAGVEARVRAVAGASQTDFVPAQIDKGVGLRALAQDLGASGDRQIAFAIGDTAADLPMFRAAATSFATSNADRALSVTIRLSQPRVAGFVEATARVLKHRPGSCAVCREPRLASRTRLLLKAQDIAGRGRVSKVRAALALGYELSRTSPDT